MDLALTDQVVLVTGASGGIGGATARVLVDEGARLVVHGHRNRPALDERPGVVAVSADLRVESDVARIFDEAIGAAGRVDAVVVNAGTWFEREADVVDLTLDQWRETLETDLTSAFLTCRAFLRHLRDRPREHASIVLVASTAALFGEAGHADYAAAKAGMAYGLTRTLRNEIVRLAPRGRVNCVCPGWTRTPMTERHMADEALLAHVFATMPLRKVATAEDVARVITVLLSDRASGHVTGAIVPVAGGMDGRLLDHGPR
ncbi:MAG: SDR family oxidoreductase [Planctomycetes bacterium]|nr:SDR family oxidoreductase [Planctomycetota bacterium]